MASECCSERNFSLSSQQRQQPIRGDDFTAPATTEDLSGCIKRATRHADGLGLEERLDRFGMATKEMKDDGNCQFRSLAFSLFGDQDYHAVVRQATIGYMRQNLNRFQALFESESELETYLAKMAQDRTWGDELTLFAAVQAYGCVAHIITSEAENWYLIYDAISKKGASNNACYPEGCTAPQTGKRVFLSYVSQIHYNALVPRHMDDVD